MNRCVDPLVRVELLIIDVWFLTIPTRLQVHERRGRPTTAARPTPPPLAAAETTAHR
jgi:hypothetical protein